MRLIKTALLAILLPLSMHSFAYETVETKAKPDQSYTSARLRPHFDLCVTQSGGVTSNIQDCINTEYAYHKARIEKSFKRIIDAPDSVQKDKLMDEIAYWWSNTDKYCVWDAKTQGQGQRLDAESCRLNRAANLADKLENRKN